MTTLTVRAEPGAGKALRTIAGDIGEGVRASSQGRVGRSCCILESGFVFLLILKGNKVDENCQTSIPVSVGSITFCIYI